MDGFYGDSGAGSGAWKTFKVAGSVGMGLAPMEGLPGPSVMLKSTQPFDAGIYQRVAVTPGKGYLFKLDWAVERIDGKGWQDGYGINRQLGIDPYGGTDPKSGNVQWTPDYYGNGKIDLQTGGVYARAPNRTFFVRVQNPPDYAGKTVEVYLDAAAVYEDTGMPPIAVDAATPTNPPAPTKPPQPTAPPATAKPTTAPTTVAEAATDAPTDTPVPQATATTPATLEPEDTPTRAPTRARRATLTPTAAAATEEGTSTSTLALTAFGGISLCGVILAVILFGAAFWYWRKSKIQPLE